MSGSGISWAICKSASRSRQITTPAHHHSRFFTGQMPFLSPNQQSQSTVPVNTTLNHITINWLRNLCHNSNNKIYKKLRYRQATMRCVVSVEISPTATQQCRNYLYDKSWPNRWYEVGDLVGGNAWQTMCTQPWRDRVGFHCLKCHKQTDDVELCISPVYRRLAVTKFSKSTM